MRNVLFWVCEPISNYLSNIGVFQVNVFSSWGQVKGWGRYSTRSSACCSSRLSLSLSLKDIGGDNSSSRSTSEDLANVFSLSSCQILSQRTGELSITCWFWGSCSSWCGCRSRGSLGSRCWLCLSLLGRFRASSGGSSTSFIVLECRYILFIFYNDRKNCTQREILGSSFIQNSSDSSLFLDFKIYSCLICLNTTDNVSGWNLVSYFDMPFTNISLKNEYLKLTFSMVGERLGISKGIWSGSDEKVLFAIELKFIKLLT